MTQNKRPWNRINFFVNEKLGLELVTTASFQQVKKIIRSERKQLERDQYLHAGKCNTFFEEHALLHSLFSQEKHHIVGLWCISISLSPPWCSFFWRHPVDFSLCISHNLPATRNSAGQWLSPNLSCVKTGRVRTQPFLLPWMKLKVSSAPARDGRWDSIFLYATDHRTI